MWQQQLVSNGISQWKTTHSFLRMVLSLSMLIVCQLKGFLFFTELYHFHGILNCCQRIVTWHHLNGMVHISSVMMHFLNTPIPQKIF
ncbi:Uncharacterized protein APZ42_008251 [Daphnia magna]|uniref:Uncharacterized protein n=1 Tax=Daphnia magna TaxID=35525 RepID=A0A164ESB8_9CRUS|nr:Uncharacterized protein APZ42_008251 [Daphnia magna]